MNQKTLIVLGAAAILAVGAALLVDRSRAPRSDVAAGAGMLVPDLREHVNDVARITLTGAGNKPLVTLARGESGWSVAQRGGYPADLAKLRDFLLALADASLVERKTSSKERHAALGVEDITAADAAGVLVDIEGLPAPTRFIVGNFDGQGGGGTFVRRADDTQSWLAKGTLSADRNPADWIRKDLADIAADRIAEVVITRASGKPLRIHKETAAATRFEIDGIPKGREAASDFVGNGPAAVLAELRIDDVAAADEAPAPADATKVRYATFDGLVVEATAWKAGDKGLARFTARLDVEVAASHIADAQAQAAAAHARDAAASKAAGEAPDEGEESADADGAEPASPAPAPLAVSDPAQDREQRLAALNAEVAKLEAAFDGWTFTLPAHKVANIDKSLEDLLKPVEPKATPGR